MAILVIVRHGQSQWNIENRFTGTVDVELTPAGEEEARKAGEKIKEYIFSEAYTSALVRAQHTLQIILKEIGQQNIPIHKDAALNERMYGDIQGLNKAEMINKYGEKQVNIWRRSYSIAPPNGESLKDTEGRVVPYFQKEIEPKLKDGENILLVAHGNSLRALVKYLEELSPEEIERREILTGIPKIYHFDPDLNVVKNHYKIETG